jgi:hypothetical protein
MEMIFYTDHSTKVSNYCLLNVKQYGKVTGKKDYMIDPSVYELKNATEYSKIELLHELAQNPKPNETISIDYPCDMNIVHSDDFIAKSKENNMRYKENPQYICTVQSYFNDYHNFRFELAWLAERIDLSKKILGVGNLCRIFTPTKVTDWILRELRDVAIERGVKRIHFYGLSMKMIESVYSWFKHEDIIISVDSTKWTRRVHTRPPLDKAICCRKETRDIYFLEYIKELKRRIPIDIKY